MTACDDKPATPNSSGTTDTVTQQQPVQAPEQVPHKPEDVLAAVETQLTAYPWLSSALTSMETEIGADGSTLLTAKVRLTVKEDLYRSENAPAAFNEERKAMNACANRAMQPNSLYLLQVGAPTDAITDEDKAARPLPENLQQLANELKDLAESSVYAVSLRPAPVMM